MVKLIHTLIHAVKMINHDYRIKHNFTLQKGLPNWQTLHSNALTSLWRYYMAISMMEK